MAIPYMLSFFSDLKELIKYISIYSSKSKPEEVKMFKAVNTAATFFKDNLPFLENDFENADLFDGTVSEIVSLMDYCNGENYNCDEFFKQYKELAGTLKNLYAPLLSSWGNLLCEEINYALLDIYDTNYYYYYLKTKLDSALTDPTAKTLITGLSYSLFGLEDCKMKNAYNLSFISQDLYYAYVLNKTIVPHCKSLKNSVIGISYYSPYFDFSYAKSSFISNIYAPLLHDSHHQKPCAPVVHLELKKRIDEYTAQFPELFNHDPLVKKFHAFLQETRHGCFFNETTRRTMNFNRYIFKDLSAETIEQLSFERAQTHNKLLQYPHTFTENVDILEKLLQLLNKQNISPVFIVFPAHYSYRNSFNPKFKEDFYKIINNLKLKYEFCIADYFDSELFDESDFVDMDHLSEKGARKMTCFTNKLLAQISSFPNS